MNNRKNIKKIFFDAKKKRIAIPAFNFDNLEMLKAIVEVAEEKKTHVMVMATESAAKYMGIAYVNELQKVARKSKYIISHWDHGFTKKDAVNALKNGWNSVMHDSSRLKFKDNVKETNYMINLGKAHDVWIEAEIGLIGGKEDDANEKFDASTSVQEAVNFYEQAPCDMLAIAVGTAHGMYQGEVNLNVKRIKEIQAKLPKANLVLHGGSGVPDSLIKKAIKAGVVKINFGTELKIAYKNGIVNWLEKNPDGYDARKFGSSGIEAVKEIVRLKIKLCKNI
ncbi:MAG: class II fructose-bisphosphate aldolase [Mycoplasmoidaceae bacterium]